MRVLLENTTFSIHKIVRNEGIIRIAGITWGKVLYEKILYLQKLGMIFENNVYTSKSKVRINKGL